MMLMLGELMGMRVFVSPFCTARKQVRFPRSRKRRIIKKWKRRESNYQEVPAAYMVNGELHAHPQVVTRIAKYTTGKA